MILWQLLPLSILFILFSLSLSLFSSISSINDYVILDSFGIMLCIIPLYILFSLINVLNNENNTINILLILVSCISSVICFISNNYIIFFVSYELSIISLLFSLFINSPYSERSIAGWYLLGYLSFGGVPLLLICIYFSLNNNIFINFVNDFIQYSLFIIFITKVPLFPFHSWLPIVHAEANSFVSILLSGYIMKLGLLGVVRLYNLSCEELKAYSLLFFMFSCYFFISCFSELDNKRWLAFLSLGHISIGILGVFNLPNESNNILSSFSLGHGLSVFILFFYFYNISLNTGSRNWIIIIYNNNNINNLILCLGILTLVAFPPCILFFNEILIFLNSITINSLIIIFSIYIFLSIIGPIGIISIVNSRLSNNITFSLLNNSSIILYSSCLMFYLYSFIL